MPACLETEGLWTGFVYFSLNLEHHGYMCPVCRKVFTDLTEFQEDIQSHDADNSKISIPVKPHWLRAMKDGSRDESWLEIDIPLRDFTDHIHNQMVKTEQFTSINPINMIKVERVDYESVLEGGEDEGPAREEPAREEPAREEPARDESKPKLAKEPSQLEDVEDDTIAGDSFESDGDGEYIPEVASNQSSDNEYLPPQVKIPCIITKLYLHMHIPYNYNHFKHRIYGTNYIDIFVYNIVWLRYSADQNNAGSDNMRGELGS